MVERIWSGDATLWKTAEADRRSIENALGWLTIAERTAETLPDLQRFVSQALPETDRVVVLGMGGSSLAPLVFSESFARPAGYPALEILDSTDPAAIEATAAASDPRRTLFIVSSKSGTTLEPNIFFDYFFDRVKKSLGPGGGAHFVVITDPGSALEKEAARRMVRRVFPGDPRIGGRYSALSNFGLVPAALAGVDVGELLRRAATMAQSCRLENSENPGLQLGAAMGALAFAGRDKLTFSVGPPIARFGMWIEQLVAESTGKEGRGILPVEGEELGRPEAYGEDRFFVRIGRGSDEKQTGRIFDSLRQAGHPAVFCPIAEALDLGGEMFRWEFATAVAGKILGINPFDQPNVQEAKDRANEILGGESRVEGRESRVGDGPDEETLRKLLDSLRPRDYFAITAYVPSTSENENALNRTRLRVRDQRHVATTVGFGPRFLHSTGQLHKGGPDTGVFLQITAAQALDVPIPGKPDSFGRVIAAQAAGDLSALKSRGRRALSVHVHRIGPGLEQLDAAVSGALSTLA
ncbi:MAG: glucose-6-phosphate isomerase [Thermoanaerobaculia bacterium]